MRLSQCGVYWWRNRQQENRPDHRFSWMHPRDDYRKGRNPSCFVSQSDRCVVPGGGGLCETILAIFGHKDYRQQLQPTTLTFHNTGGPTALQFEGPDPPSPGNISPLTVRDVDPDYFPHGTGNEAAEFLDQLLQDSSSC